MFSLIITIICIALLAALCLATIYYGGSAFTKGGDGLKLKKLERPSWPATKRGSSYRYAHLV